jgi:hypothetical protein
MNSITGRTVLRLKRAWRPLSAAATVVALAGFTGALAVQTAGAATVRTGTLALSPAKANTLPHYYTPLSFTTTVTNLSTTTASNGVSVTVAAPAALISPSVTVSAGSYNGTSTWTVGTLAPGASATLTIAGFAGDVDAGLQTVTATLTSTTPDPNSANNTASASEKSQPATLGVKITGDPGNPLLTHVEIHDTGNIGFTGAAYNADNPSAPAPNADTFWFCSSLSGNNCPASPALESPNVAHLSWPIPSFQMIVDTWQLSFEGLAKDDNPGQFPRSHCAESGEGVDKRA